MITYKGQSMKASDCGTSLEQLRRIRKELSYYQQLAEKLSEEVKHLATTKTEALQQLRLQQSEMRRMEQTHAQLQQQVRQKQALIEQLSGKLTEIEQRCLKYEHLNDRLKRQRSEFQLEQTRLLEQLARAQLSTKTMIIGGTEDSRYDRQPTRHNRDSSEAVILGQKITELTNQLQRCQSAQGFPAVNQPSEKLLLKYERVKHELSNLKSQLRTERKEASIVISNLQEQHDQMRSELDHEKVASETLTLRNLELTEHIKELNIRLERTIGSLQQLQLASQATLNENGELQEKLRQLELSHSKLLKFNEETQEDLGGQLQKVAQVMRSLMDEKEALQRRNTRLMRELRSRNLSCSSNEQ